MENQLIFSESFIDFLRKISDESKIARLILSCRRARNDGFHYLYNAALKMDEVNYITYRDNGLMSYMPADRQQEYNDDSTWKRDGRQEGKPARVMRRIFTKNALKCLKDSDFEIFNNKYKSQYSTADFLFEVRPASDIPDVYCMRLMDGGSSLNGSCMNGDREYLSLYKECSALEIVTLKTEAGLLAGRCLLWTLEYEGETIKLADRFYVAEDHLYDAFLTYIETNKWWRKKYYKTYNDKAQFIMPNGENIIHKFTVQTATDFSYYPYIDTFSFGGEGFLTNDDDGQYTYTQTDGTREGGSIYDEIADEWISEEDAVQIERGQRKHEWTHMNNTVDINGDTWWKDDDEIRLINDEWYHQDDVVYCDVDGEEYLLEDCVYSEHHGTHILISDAYKVAGDYYHESVVEKL
jgi:hypothetical protein